MNVSYTCEFIAGPEVVKLGIAFSTVPPEPDPLVIKRITAETWADDAGIAPGDVLIGLNGRDVNGMGPDDFRRLMAERPLSVRVTRPPQKQEEGCPKAELEDVEATMIGIQEASTRSIEEQEEEALTSDKTGEAEFNSFELHDIVIEDFPNRCIGIRLHKASLRVMCITEPGAGNTWCVNDQITAVQHQKVANYDEWLSIILSIIGEQGERCIDSQITITVMRSKAVESSNAEKATLGMAGGVLGGGAFALSCGVVVGGGWVVAAASVVPISLGGLSGTAVGVRRTRRDSAFFSGALAGFAGPTATTAFLGGEIVVEACADASEVDV